MIGQMPEPTLWRLTIRPFFTRRFLSRIKEKGQRPFHSSHIIPQQRVGTEIMALFWAQKFGFLLFLIGDNFYSLDPIRKPPFLRGWRAKIRPKNWCKMRSKHLLTRAYHRTGKPSRKIRAIVTLQPPVQRVKVSSSPSRKNGVQNHREPHRGIWELLTEQLFDNILQVYFADLSMGSSRKLDFDLWHSSSWPMV